MHDCVCMILILLDAIRSIMRKKQHDLFCLLAGAGRRYLYVLACVWPRCVESLLLHHARKQRPRGEILLVEACTPTQPISRKQIC